MPINYIDDRPLEGLGQVGVALANRINAKKIRAKQLAENPAMMAQLAPAYRAAKASGQDANFFASLGVDPEFGALLDGFTPSSAERYETEMNKLGTPEERARLDYETARTNLSTLNRGREALDATDAYLDSLPDDDFGNHLRLMSQAAIADPGLYEELQRHESGTGDLSGNGSGGSSGSSGGGSSSAAGMLNDYTKWRTAHNDALERWRESKGDPNARASAYTDLNNLALLAEQMQREGALPPFPVRGVREARGFLGIRKTLEEFNSNPEMVDRSALAIESVLMGETPEGNPATLADLQNSNFFKELPRDEQLRINTIINSRNATAGEGEEDSKPSYFETLAMIAKNAGNDVASAVAGGARGARNVAGNVARSVRGGPSEATAAETSRNPRAILDSLLNSSVSEGGNRLNSDGSISIPRDPSMRPPATYMGRPGLDPTVREPAAPAPNPASAPIHEQMSNWVQKLGFQVTSTTGGEHNEGSRHGRGMAVDVRTRNKTDAEIQTLITRARSYGFRVLDERRQPRNQRVWSGPHVHIEIPAGVNPPVILNKLLEE